MIDGRVASGVTGVMLCARRRPGRRGDRGRRLVRGLVAGQCRRDLGPGEHAVGHDQRGSRFRCPQSAPSSASTGIVHFEREQRCLVLGGPPGGPAVSCGSSGGGISGNSGNTGSSGNSGGSIRRSPPCAGPSRPAHRPAVTRAPRDVAPGGPGSDGRARRSTSSRALRPAERRRSSGVNVAEHCAFAAPWRRSARPTAQSAWCGGIGSPHRQGRRSSALGTPRRAGPLQTSATSSSSTCSIFRRML